MANKCNDCVHKSEVDIYNYQTCMTCEHNPFVIVDRFRAKEVEIRPENAGELWKGKTTGDYYHTEIIEGELKLIGRSKAYNIGQKERHGEIYTLLYPPVEDESVERVEIEGVTWRKETGQTIIFPNSNRPDGTWASLIGKPPMKMILEIPKEK